MTKTTNNEHYQVANTIRELLVVFPLRKPEILRLWHPL